VAGSSPEAVVRLLNANFEIIVPELVARNGVIDKLRSLVKPNGIYCVILASAESRAYEFKREAYQLIGNGDQFFMTAREFRRLLKARKERFTEEIVDTYIDTNIFCDRQQGRNKEALEWLSYFLRIDCSTLDASLRERLIELVHRFSLPFCSLPEQLRSYYQKYPAPCGPPNEDTQLVFHKESVFLARPGR